MRRFWGSRLWVDSLNNEMGKTGRELGCLACRGLQEPPAIEDPESRERADRSWNACPTKDL